VAAIPPAFDSEQTFRPLIAHKAVLRHLERFFISQSIPNHANTKKNAPEGFLKNTAFHV
jgi:hypothetical protein